jgi:hypothetical protein
MAARPALVEIPAQLRVGAMRLVPPGRREAWPATEVNHDLKIDISYNQETGRLLLNLAQLYEWRRKPLQGYTWAHQAVRSVQKLAAARGCAAEALFEWMPGETAGPGAPPRRTHVVDTWEKQALSARGFKCVGKRSHYTPYKRCGGA